MVTLRALRARSASSLALFAMGALAVAGCVTATGYSRMAQLPVGAAGALLLLGAVALAGQAAASVRARQHEVALAELRGRHGLGLLVVAVAEPVVLLVVGAAAGTFGGWAVARAAVRRWVSAGSTFEMTHAEWLTAAGVLVVGVAVVVVASWRTAYEPLRVKLDSMDRPKPATAGGLFLGLLVLVSAVVSVYQAHQVGVQRADWVSFVSPALLGLAAGQVGVWLVGLAARLAMSSPRVDVRLGWFLTLRRLTRRRDSIAAIRLVVAAVVVAGVAGSAWVGAGAWRDQTARLRTGGPVTFTVPAGALAAYLAAHEADPDGRWLMAMSAAPDPSGGSYRDVFVDTARWQRVVGSFFAGTPVAEVSAGVAALRSSRLVRPAHGRQFTVEFSARSVRRAWLPKHKMRKVLRRRYTVGFAPLAFTLTYVDSDGNQQPLRVPNHWGKPARVRPGVAAYSASLPGCAHGCAVARVAVQGITRAPLRITRMSFGDLSLVPAAPDGLTLAGTRALSAHLAPGGLVLRVTEPNSPLPLLVARPAPVQPALTTPSLRLHRAHGEPQVYGPDGVPRTVDVVGEVAALPLIGRTGSLLDLPTALRGAGGQIPQSRSLVVARDDTPVAVRRQLVAAGAVRKQHTFGHALADLQRSGTAAGTRLFMLIAAFGLLIAAISVVSTASEQRRERRREAASLRVVGVGVRQVSAGYRREAQALGVAVAVIAAAAIWVGCRALLGVLPLVQPGQFGLPFDATPKIELVVGLAVVAGAVVAVVIFLGFRLIGRSSPPRLLREED